MHRRRVITLLSLVAVELAAGSRSYAGEPILMPATADNAAQVDLEVGALVGLDTPAGTFGIEGQLGFTPWLALAVGGGATLFAGPQGAVTLRARIPFGARGQTVVFAGAGMAQGHYRSPAIGLCFFAPCPVPDADGEAIYVTSEVGLEQHIDGVFGRVFAGGKRMSNFETVCLTGHCDRYFPYAGVIAGVRF
jgi:hypothetical protein